MKPAWTARARSAQILAKVDAGAHAEDLLDEPELRPSDRAHARFLTLGVLRRRGELDQALSPWVKGGLPSLEPAVLGILRVGAFELFFAGTPPHAAVSEAVDATRSLGVGRAGGLVNAVLRRVTSRPRPSEPGQNLPAWLLARWKARWGDRALAYAQALDEPPPLTLVGPDALQALDEAGLTPRPASVGDRLPPECWRIEGSSGSLTPLLATGRRCWIQDPSAVVAADFVEARPGLTVLDAAAAPGGKSLRLASQGAQVWATDRSARRLQAVVEASARTGLPLRTQVVDWERPAPAPLTSEAFGAVLLDAPCSGLGLLRRHPEIRWRRQETDLHLSGGTQLQLLRGLADRVSPGGRLVYAVCSPEPEEGEGPVQKFLAERGDFRLAAQWATPIDEQGSDAHQVFRLERS